MVYMYAANVGNIFQDPENVVIVHEQLHGPYKETATCNSKDGLTALSDSTTHKL